jgi:hypothetical protein
MQFFGDLIAANESLQISHEGRTVPADQLFPGRSFTIAQASDQRLIIHDSRGWNFHCQSKRHWIGPAVTPYNAAQMILL